MRKLLLGASALAVVAACTSTSNIETEPVVAETPIAVEVAVESDTSIETEKVAFETYSAEAFFQTTSFGLASSTGYAWSSDGTRVLAHSDASGVFNAITIDADGLTEQLTTSETDAHFAQSFFPNDDRIIVTADQGGNELNHIYVRELDGTLVDVTPGDEVKASFGGWRADNEVFYVWHNGRDSASFDLYAVDPADYATTMVFENPGFQPGALSDSGRWLALDKPRTSADSDVYVVDLSAETPEPVLVTAHEGNIAHGTYDFTPDETKLVYSTNEFGEFNQAWTHDLVTGEKASLIEADWDVSFVFYSPSGQYQIHAINADGLTDLTITDTSTGEEVVLNGVPEGELGQIRFSPDETKIAFGLNTDTSPYNLYMTELGGEAVRLTDALNPEISEENLVTATVERFEASDGVTIPGIMYKPKQASADTPVPALVWVHGGPGGQSTRGYSAAIQHMVNHGYAIYAANNRGSSGYGKTYVSLDNGLNRKKSVEDIGALLDWVETQPDLDKDRIVVFGGSYGGYMVLASMIDYAERGAGGINIVGISDFKTFLTNTKGYRRDLRRAEYGDDRDPEIAAFFDEISPLRNADKITKPLFIIQGLNDPRVPASEAEQILEAVRANEGTAWYLLAKDEGHGFRKKSNRDFQREAETMFLEKLFKGELK